MTIGTRIKEYRTKSKLSQEKVAELVGVSRQAVTKWESDQSTPNMDNLFRLAEIFGTTVDALVTDETHKGTVAELVYHMIQEEEQRKRKALREKLRLRIRDGLAVLGCYLVIFLISKLLWADRENFSLIGWLTNTWYEHHAPCFGWILVHKWFWSAAFFSVAMALLGFRRISLITIVGCALGLLLGEYTGNLPGLINHHFGYEMWAFLYQGSIFFGIWLQFFKPEEMRLTAKKMWLLLILYVAYAAAVVILVLACIPESYT